MEKPFSTIITGASTGLGLELGVRLATAEQLVIGVARHFPNDARWKNLEAKGHARFIKGDVSDPEVVERVIATANELGTYNLLINCAGQGVFGAASSYTSDDVVQVLSGNLIGLILFCGKSVESFSTTHGTIVNIMSTASQVGRANETVYCAAKWGARGYTEALKAELKGRLIRILAVYPGGMRTPFWANAKGHNVNPEKFMDPSRIAEAVVSAISNLYVTDLTLNRP